MKINAAIISVIITVCVIGGAIMLGEEKPTEYQINKGLEKVNGFIEKCSEPYKVTIANSNYQFSCDAGYITVEPYIFNVFNESK
ncbi:TPA: hypothetical protein R4229_003959 [Morganella morganii]|nr:hypothetical protein [Morganella morganii]